MINSGLILINKPSGPTSHDIVDKLRRITGIRKIGHAGTLDPFASGLLILAVGRESTREISKIVGLDKTYIAKIRLGAHSNTHDRTGEVTETKSPPPSLATIEKIIKTFLGEQDQIPPMHSAIKIKGKKLYNLARKGIEIERPPRKITIYEIVIIDYSWPYLNIETTVSSGTYIRSLAYDLGKKLDTGALLEELTRTSIGNYKLSDSIDPENLSQSDWQKKLIQFVDKA